MSESGSRFIDDDRGRAKRRLGLVPGNPQRRSAALRFALLLPISLFLAVGAQAAGREYVGVDKCKTCHKKEAMGSQYGKWLESKHAKAFEVLGTPKAKEVGAKAGVSNPQTDGACLKCHTTAYGVDASLVSSSLKQEEGVGCEACHGAGKDYRKKKVMMDRELAVANGLVIPDEKTCVGCHNDKNPTWNPAKYTRADGSKTGFDFDQAFAKIKHPVPEGYDPSGEGEAD